MNEFLTNNAGALIQGAGTVISVVVSIYISIKILSSKVTDLISKTEEIEERVRVLELEQIKFDTKIENIEKSVSNIESMMMKFLEKK